MSLSSAWELLKQSLLEYAIFIPLDLWAKSALKHSTSAEERQHIWASEAQLLLIGSIVALVWHRVYPVVTILLAFFCYRSSQSPGVTPININIKEISLKGLLVGQILNIWLFISVAIGNLVSKLFDKIRGRSEKEQAAEAILLKVGVFITKCINFIFEFVKESAATIYRNCVDWEEIFRSGQWYTYQCVSQEQFLGQPPDVSSDRLLCHPECELSQRNPYRATSNVNGNHIIQESNKKPQAPSCNSHITSAIRNSIKTQSKRFLKFLRCFLQNAYYQLQQCHQIQLMPYTVDTSSGENLCFMNTVLNCFTREPSLSRFLNETVNEQSIERLNLPVEETQFLQSLHQLLVNEKGSEQYRKQFSRSCSMLIPTLVSPPGNKQQQQDVVEFAQWLLNTLHHCFKTTKEHNTMLFKKSSKGHMLLDAHHSSTTVLRGNYLDKAQNSILHPSDTLIKNMQQYANLEWLAYTRENSSPITSNFTGQMVESYQCMMCNQISAQRQTFIVLPLALPTDSSSISLQDIIKKFLDVEDMEVKEGCWCNNPSFNSPVHRTAASFENNVLETPIFSFTKELSAKTSTPLSAEETSISVHDSQILSPIETTFGVPGSQPVSWYANEIGLWMKKRWLKRTFISKAPKYLILQLMRFQFDNKSLTKNHYSVRIPLYNLCIPLLEHSPIPWELKVVTAQKEYELCAIIVHLGAKSMSCGHYVAYVRSSDPSVWHRCDDHMAVKVADIIEEVDSETIKENAYLLFYKQTSKGG